MPTHYKSLNLLGYIDVLIVCDFFCGWPSKEDRIHRQLSKMLEFDFQRRTPLRRSHSIEDFARVTHTILSIECNGLSTQSIIIHCSRHSKNPCACFAIKKTCFVLRKQSLRAILLTETNLYCVPDYSVEHANVRVQKNTHICIPTCNFSWIFRAQF